MMKDTAMTKDAAMTKGTITKCCFRWGLPSDAGRSRTPLAANANYRPTPARAQRLLCGISANVLQDCLLGLGI
jgi:hypothetical protein